MNLAQTPVKNIGKKTSTTVGVETSPTMEECKNSSKQTKIAAKWKEKHNSRHRHKIQRRKKAKIAANRQMKEKQDEQAYFEKIEMNMKK